MLRRISAYELTEWEIFYRIEAEERAAAEEEDEKRSSRNWP